MQRAGTLAPLTGAVVLTALASVALALAGFIGFLGWGLLLIAAAFMLVDLARTMPLAAAPFYGAGLLLAGELVYASRELARHDEEHARRRLPWLAGVALAGLGIGFVPVAATGVSAPAGFGAELIALSAAALLLGIPALLVRRRQDVPTTSGKYGGESRKPIRSAPRAAGHRRARRRRRAPARSRAAVPTGRRGSRRRAPSRAG